MAAAVFAFRGTKLNKAGNLRADLHLLQDLNAEMVVTQRATKKVQNHIRRLQEQFQSVRWSFYTTGVLVLQCDLEYMEEDIICLMLRDQALLYTTLAGVLLRGPCMQAIFRPMSNCNLGQHYCVFE